MRTQNIVTTIEDLRVKLMNVKRDDVASPPRAAAFSERSDSELVEWKRKWIKPTPGDEVEKEQLKQALFRQGMVLENDTYRDFYYSFCRKGWEKESYTWHCPVCKECKEWEDWHCEECNEGTYGQSIPCEECGGVTESYEYMKSHGQIED